MTDEEKFFYDEDNFFPTLDTSIYIKTQDLSRQLGKEYYKLNYIQVVDPQTDDFDEYFEEEEKYYSKVNNPILEDINNYYEKIDDNNYIKTNDTTIDENKDYYAISWIDYLETLDSTNDSSKVYYQISENQPYIQVSNYDDISKCYEIKKDYYKITYEQVQEKNEDDLNEYYEEVNGIYQETWDDTLKDNKNYYRIKFVEVLNPQQSKIEDYYESVETYNDDLVDFGKTSDEDASIITVDAEDLDYILEKDDENYDLNYQEVTGQLDENETYYIKNEYGSFIIAEKPYNNSLTYYIRQELSDQDQDPIDELRNEFNSLLAAADAMIFKGVVNSASDLPATHNAGWTYKVATAGTYAGITCEVGDMIICITDGNVANNNDWTVIQTNVDGAVIGPVNSTQNHVAVFNNETGKVIADSGYTIEKSVPTNAIFTDTTYTFSTNGVGFGEFKIQPSNTSDSTTIALDISNKENINNKKTSISNLSTNTDYPSAKAVYDYIDNQNFLTSHQDLSNYVQNTDLKYYSFFDNWDNTSFNTFCTSILNISADNIGKVFLGNFPNSWTPNNENEGRAVIEILDENYIHITLYSNNLQKYEYLFNNTSDSGWF